MRKILSAFLLLLLLLCGFSTQTEEEMIYPQSVRITVEETGNYKLSFEGTRGINEYWAWFACPDKDSAEDLMNVMRDAIADGTPARSLTFDLMFKTWQKHGTETASSVSIPADSGYVFYGRAYCVHAFGKEPEVYMITLGGTNLSKIKPGEIGGNDLEDNDIPPKTGDSANLFLLVSLLAASSLGFIVLIKRNEKIRAAR